MPGIWFSTVGALILTLGAAPAADPAPGNSVTYRNSVASTLNPAITPAKCTTVRIGVNYDDPDRQLTAAGSSVTVTPATGIAVTTTTPTWADGVSTAHHTLRLCGLDAPHPETSTGIRRVTVRTGGVQSAQFPLTVRYQARVTVNATPEPVRRGSSVSLRAWVTDGWEYFDNRPVRFYFQATGATTWRYLGSATPRCDTAPCGDGEVAYVADRRFRQTVSGTWKAISQRTSYLEAGSGTDAVRVF